MKGRKVFFGVLAILAGSQCGCDDRSLAMAPEKNGATSGSARKIAASGAVFQVGSSGDQSAREESPGWTRFSHDFWLDTTEATQAEFLSLMGRNPSPTSATGPSKPVVNATWFDAILFCNARSKRDGLDTVYEYRSLSRDAAGSVWEIQGLASRLERSGWRLPTEAEWEFAARAGTSTAYPWGELADSAKAVEYAWYQKNAAASLHEVARLKPNAWGIYDMSGNAMEWVQDWKGSFPKDTVVDFTGLDAPADIPEAPLKGGAYTYGLEHLRPSSRSATYAAYRSAKAEYVGFRCARGGFAPTYTNASGQSVQAPPVSIVRPDLATLLGAQSARLVFLNRSNGKGVLSWIDFGEAVPVVRSLLDKDPVFHPSISPDGQWVAWCTVMEGSTGVSRIKARRLSKNDTLVFDLGEGAIPRWWVNGLDTFLVRAKALDNTSSDWGATSTTAQRWSNGTLTGSVQTWSSAGSYHDGRSGQYLYTGYRRLRQHDVVGGKDRTLFSYPQNGKRVGDTSQVCNVSAAPDGSGRVLFLDFGYSGASTVVGRPYGIHEVAFVADSLGDIVKTLAAPEGKSQWDHLEWSNHSRWAVGMALEAGGQYRGVHLLDLGAGSSVVVLSGDEIWMPSLWIGSGESDDRFAADSLMMYDRPTMNPYQAGFAAKAAAFWAQRDSFEIVAVGSSHVYHGISPADFSRPTFNFGVAGGDLQMDDALVRNLVLNHAPRLKVVILGVMPGWLLWAEDQGVGVAIRNSAGWKYDQSHGFWTDSVPKAFSRLAALKDWTEGGVLEKNGNRPSIAVGWGGASPLGVDVANDSLSGAVFGRNWSRLEGLVEDVAGRGVEVVLVNFPVSPHFRNTPRAGRWEPYWNTYHEILKRLRDLQKLSPRIHFVDANLDGLHDYPDADALDWDHLASTGASRLSRRLDSLVEARLSASRP